jgi:hypothetical protein
VVHERDVSAGLSQGEGHSQRVRTSVVRMLEASCQPTTMRL